jgi:hypothetical protein
MFPGKKTYESNRFRKECVEKNDLHLVTFGIFAHVNFPVPLYFFSKYRTISSVNKCHESNWQLLQFTKLN